MHSRLDPSTRQQLLALFTLPRHVFESRLDVEECPHHRNYDAGDRRCKECLERQECVWLSDDEYIPLERKSDRQLIDALQFSIHYVAGVQAVENHQAEACRCELCNWSRKAVTLYEKASGEKL